MSSLTITVSYSAGSLIVQGPGAPQVVQVSTPSAPTILQLGTLSAAANQQITQAVSASAASAQTSSQQAGIATEAAQAAAAAYAEIAQGTAPAYAGPYTGNEKFSFSSGGDLHSGVLADLAGFSIETFQGYMASAPNAVARTIQDKVREAPISPEDINPTAGTGADDSATFALLIASGRRVQLTRGKTYLIRNFKISGISNFELDGNGATIVSDQTSSILGFTATSWGQSANVYVHDLTLYYTNNPNNRTDNVFPLWFQYVNGVQVERVRITNSWSAGVIFNVCSKIHAYTNDISNTLADGMTCFGCGRDVTYFDNVFTNTADDAMAVTWLAGNTAGAVGETTIRTKSVRILFNEVNGTTVSARGLFIGGTEGLVVTGNRFYNVAACSIIVSNTTTVATYSTDVLIDGNICVNSGQAASSLVGEIGGIAIYPQNLRVVVTRNIVSNANNCAFLLEGNVYATRNYIFGTTNRPSPQNPSLLWLGAGIVWADFTGSNTCYGTCDDNEIWNTVYRAIWIGAGYNSQFLSVCGNKFHDCVDPVAVGTAALGVLYFDSTARNQIVALGNQFYESRTNQVVQYCIYVAGGGLHDVDKIDINLGSGVTKPSTPIGNASGGTAIKRFLQATWNPGGGSAIAMGTPVTQNFSIADANLRDYVSISAPYQIPLMFLSGFVQSLAVVTGMLACLSSTPQTPLGPNTYTFRVRRT